MKVKPNFSNDIDGMRFDNLSGISHLKANFASAGAGSRFPRAGSSGSALLPADRAGPFRGLSANGVQHVLAGLEGVVELAFSLVGQ